MVVTHFCPLLLIYMIDSISFINLLKQFGQERQDPAIKVYYFEFLFVVYFWENFKHTILGQDIPSFGIFNLLIA